MGTLMKSMIIPYYSSDLLLPIPSNWLYTSFITIRSGTLTLIGSTTALSHLLFSWRSDSTEIEFHWPKRFWMFYFSSTNPLITVFHPWGLNEGHGQDAHLWHVCRWNPPGKTTPPRKDKTSNQVAIWINMHKVWRWHHRLYPKGSHKTHPKRKTCILSFSPANFSIWIHVWVHRGSNSLFTWQIKQIETIPRSKVWKGVNKGLSSNAAAATKQTLHGNVGKREIFL